jgi:hypothetical protein
MRRREFVALLSERGGGVAARRAAERADTAHRRGGGLGRERPEAQLVVGVTFIELDDVQARSVLLPLYGCVQAPERSRNGLKGEGPKLIEQAIRRRS